MVSPTPRPFEPELEEILRDIARDPRSSLLRIERPANPASLADSWEALSHWTPGLTAAEKELLVAHRAEAAHLLRQRWLHEVTTRPRRGFCLVRSSSSTPGSVGGDRAQEAQRRRSELRSLLLADAEGDLAASLTDIEEDRALDPATLSGLLVTAERLQPQTVGKLMVAQDLVINAQPRSAVSLLRRSMEYETRPWMRSYLWHNLGLAAGTLGNLHAAFTCYARASEAGEPQLETLAQWLLLAMQTGNIEAALEAASHLEDMTADSNASILLSFCQEQDRTRVEGAWSPSHLAAMTLTKVRERVGPAAQRVLNVLD